MRSLLIGVSLLVLAAPAALAQQASDPTVEAVSGPVQPGRYLVFFELDRATLTSNGRSVVAEAAQEFQRTGAARVSLAGHADRSASATYNQRLSERRVEAVRNELVRLGVPDGAIARSRKARPTRSCKRPTAYARPGTAGSRSRSRSRHL
jgi:outer membrane protein OmpA-like peptidoglycan-associated protein